MKSTKRKLLGINIQFPISRLILDGTKTIETRTYPIPSEYIGQEMAIIETPGKDGGFKSRVVGVVRFGESFPYESEKDFYKDSLRHRVTKDSPWRWDAQKPKWGWPILAVVRFDSEIAPPPRRGIKYTRSVLVPTSPSI